MTDETHIPMDKLTKVYVKIREAIAEKTKEYDTVVEAMKAQQAAVASQMKDQLRASGQLSAKTEFGTVSLKTTTRYYAMDKDAFKAFVLEHQAIDLLEQRIAQKNMGEFLAANPTIAVPGLNTASEIEISVRKPTQ